MDRTQWVLVHAPGEDQVPIDGKDPLTKRELGGSPRYRTHCSGPSTPRPGRTATPALPWRPNGPAIRPRPTPHSGPPRTPPIPPRGHRPDQRPAIQATAQPTLQPRELKTLSRPDTPDRLRSQPKFRLRATPSPGPSTIPIPPPSDRSITAEERRTGRGGQTLSSRIGKGSPLFLGEPYPVG